MTSAIEDQTTEHLVSFVRGFHVGELAASDRHEFVRALVDSLGCIVGGSRHPAVATATKALTPFFSSADASLLGQEQKADVLHAALVNGLAGASYSYFDSYSSAHLHAGVVHLAALLAVAERVQATGTELLSAFAAGVEIACRLTDAIAVPPAQAHIGWSVGGIVCPLSSALAVGRLLGLDDQQMSWALGIAATGAGGTRAEQGAMTAGLIYGQAAQTGVRAALLAQGGFTSSSSSLTGKHGYANVFSMVPNLSALVDGLGTSYRGTATTYKPFPTDIAIHPAIDATLRLVEEHDLALSDIRDVAVTASELAGAFCDRPTPADELEAKFSLQHWVAATVARGKATVEEGSLAVVTDPEVRRVASATKVVADPQLAWDAVHMTVDLVDGRRVETTITHCVGSPEFPMSDDDLTAKFVSQASLAIGTERAEQLAQTAWDVEDVHRGAELAALAR